MFICILLHLEQMWPKQVNVKDAHGHQRVLD